MPSKKGSQSYRASLARDRLKTAIKNVSTTKGMTKNQRAFNRNLVRQMQEISKATFQPKKDKGKLSPKQVRDIDIAIARANTLADSAKLARGAHGASNMFYQIQLNLASREYEYSYDNPSMYTKAESKTFYRLTQNIWEGKTKVVNGRDTGIPDTAGRNKEIMKALGTQDLGLAIEFILSREGAQQVKMGYDIEGGKIDPNQMTAKQREMYEKLTAGDTQDNAKGSPPWIGAIQPIEFSSTEARTELRAQFRAWLKERNGD